MSDKIGNECKKPVQQRNGYVAYIETVNGHLKKVHVHKKCVENLGSRKTLRVSEN